MISEDKIHIANVLLTRRCNLNCSYCAITKNQGRIPAYPKMDWYKDNELISEKWIQIIKRLRLNNKDMFFIFYGGEPLLYSELSDILKYCNENNVNYTVISNNTDGVQKRIEEVISKIGKFKGFTSSVDPIENWKEHKNKELSDIEKKSMCGILRLSDMKRKGIADDVVAEITATSQNIKYLYNTIKILTDNGIWSSITAIDDKKNDLYDFSTIEDQSLMLQPTKEVRDIFTKIQEDKSLLVHMPELLDELFKVLPSNMKCKIYENVHNICLDSDGSFRLCLRIRGISTPCISVKGGIFSDGRPSGSLLDALEYDYNNFCLGCNWTCMLISQQDINRILNH